jgi:DNA-binding IclR family transcriptional regulator
MRDISSVGLAEKVEPEAGRERSGVQSIERAFSILNQISQHHGIGLAELSKKVGLHNSTAFHLVRTMVELGIVRQDKNSKRYHLGRVIFSLAASSMGEVELVGAATPFLESLAALTGETSHMALRSGSDVVIAAKVGGTGAFQLVERTGGIRPFNCTALGKVLLSGFDDDELRDFIAALPMHAPTPKAITNPDLLWEEIMRVRESGIGFDDAEYDGEVRCLAAPVYDFRGQMVAAIGVSGPVWRISLQRVHQLAEQVKNAAWDLSKELGYKLSV